MDESYQYPFDSWLPTEQAARSLGVHSCTLKRYKEEFFIYGSDWYKSGGYKNSKLMFHLDRCREKLKLRGRKLLKFT